MKWITRRSVWFFFMIRILIKIILWDEYLIYSVLFSHTKKIIDEYKNLIVINSYQQNC